MDILDKATKIRTGEELNKSALTDYLSQQGEAFNGPLEIKQFPSGFSNLTYLLTINNQEYVLRRPPFGANIKSAHDMGREFKVLSLLQAHYDKIPKPILNCADETIIGAPFYIMERVQGVILRSRIPKGMDVTPDFMRQISISLVENLADLHNIEVENTGLIEIGKPEGYAARQVNGWIKRYYNAETDKIPAMDLMAAWMKEHLPKDNPPALIHNDYKYDNIVLDPTDWSKIKAVLDWEMATVGDPLMDLGTTLAYWVAAEENDVLKPFNISWLPGNLNRAEMVEAYLSKSKLDFKAADMLFYYIFGCFKVGTIAQQIYARFKKGHTKDKRFAIMIYLVKAGAANGAKALELGRISNLW